YPNPSDLASTFIILPEAAASKLSLRIFDISRVLVHSSEIILTPDNPVFRLPDLSWLPPGIYVAEVTNGSSIWHSARLVKL
ncbi:MAG: T9SS C-terminal target domain-containing protein, partial [Bacteroidetes bacterium]